MRILIGCEFSGVVRDATPAAKMLAGLCEHLIVHPNVVCASDINEMTPNMLFVEGSTIDRLLRGEIGLKKVKKYNRVLVVTNKPAKPETVNSVSAARACIGGDFTIMELDYPLIMGGGIDEKGEVISNFTGQDALIGQIEDYGRDKFDALAIHSIIEVDMDTKLAYFRGEGSKVNPWGKVEADVTKIIANAFDMPVAHAPIEQSSPTFQPEYYNFKEVVDPRMAAECVSVSYLNCILKGLHRAPRISGDWEFDLKCLSNRDIDFLVSPASCFGPPHKAAQKNNIPIIYVEENECVYRGQGLVLDGIYLPGFEFIEVGNYLEAAGVIAAAKAGVDWRTTRRPLPKTKII